MAGDQKYLKGKYQKGPANKPGDTGTKVAVSPNQRFSGARFEAKLYEAKHLPSGEMRLVLLVPERDKPEGTKMADAFACALVVDVSRKPTR